MILETFGNSQISLLCLASTIKTLNLCLTSMGIWVFEQKLYNTLLGFGFEINNAVPRRWRKFVCQSKIQRLHVAFLWRHFRYYIHTAFWPICSMLWGWRSLSNKWKISGNMREVFRNPGALTTQPHQRTFHWEFMEMVPNSTPSFNSRNM